MREITILSGKGGTGKTSITAALGSLAKNAVFCDNDVDAADLHLIFQPEIKEENTFFSGWKMRILSDKCTHCNSCVAYCRFNAIHFNGNGDMVINPFQCEGCRLCERICPEKAIISEKNNSNHWYVSATRFGTLVHAKMVAGEENSGKLVTQIRKRAKEAATEANNKFIINDGPPGIGCTAIASLSGTDIALVVLEPTKSGLHDARRLVELIQSFEIEAMAVINKYDVSIEVALRLEKFLKTRSIPVIAKLPFDTEMVNAMTEGKTILEYNPQSGISQMIKNIWKEISSKYDL